MARQGFPFGTHDYGYLGHGYETPGNPFGDGPGFNHEPNPGLPHHFPVGLPHWRVIPIRFPNWNLPITTPRWTHPVQLGTRVTNYVVRLVNGLPTYMRRR